MNRSVWLVLLFIAVICAACSLLAANILFGNLNQDEGWYLYAARMVSSGNLPYRDFAYTQMPVMPFVYSLIQPLIKTWGLTAGRLFTAVLGIVGAFFAAALAGRLTNISNCANGGLQSKGRRIDVALLAFMLVILNVYQTYFFAVVKTYALTALFLLAGFFVLSLAIERRSRFAAFLAGAVLVLAAGTRSSAAVILPIVFVCMCFERSSLSFHGWMWFGLGGVLMACIVVIPFLIMAPESFWFCVVKYHALRQSGSIWKILTYKAGFLSRMIQAYFVTFALWLVVVFGQLFLRGWSKSERTSSLDGSIFFTRMIWACLIGVTIVHLSAPFPYDDYQVFIYPLFGVVVSVMAVRFVDRMDALISIHRPTHAWGRSWLLLAVFSLSLGAAVSSPINQDWFIQGRDRIWWRLKDQSSLSRLRQTGKMIRSMTRPGDLLLTGDPYLAVESGLTLPHGLEMGQFSYFPGLSRETAEKFHVVNRVLLEELLKTCDAPLAAFSGYAFAIESPQINPVPMDDQLAFWSIIERRYELLREIPNFGQAFTMLQILKKRRKYSDSH